MASLDPEREKEVAFTNPSGKKKKSSSGGGKKKKKKHAKKAKRSNPAKGGHSKKKKGGTRRRRRRNPGMDVKGALAVKAGAVVGTLLAQPAAHIVNQKLVEPNKDGKSHPKLARFLRILAPEAVGDLLMLGANAAGLHNVAKGASAAGTSVATLHGMSALANASDKPPDFMAKAGFAQLGAMEDYYVGEDGHVYKRGKDGQPQLMFGANFVPMVLEDQRGNEIQVAGVGQLAEGALIMRDGRFQLLPGVQINGIQPRTGLSGVQQQTPLNGVRGETDLSGVNATAPYTGRTDFGA